MTEAYPIYGSRGVSRVQVEHWRVFLMVPYGFRGLQDSELAQCDSCLDENRKRRCFVPPFGRFEKERSLAANG